MSPKEILHKWLEYFNDALNKYQDIEKVMHVTAYMYPIPHEKLPETFFLRIASSQAWATWDRAWKHFEPDVDQLIAKFDEKARYQFELEGGMNFWKHMMEFKHGRNNSWAIRSNCTSFFIYNSTKPSSINPIEVHRS